MPKIGLRLVRHWRSPLKFATIGLAVVLLSATSAFPCTGIMGTPESWITGAEAILRVRALEERRQGVLSQLLDRAPSTRNEQLDTKVRFEVIEALKGMQPATVVEFEGMLGDGDDPNDRSVPYDRVRPGGRTGRCFAYGYKKGGEYLLFLRTRNGELTPYWATMAATNEQLFGPDDKWVAWVREHLKG
jgi:hypothetical protein